MVEADRIRDHFLFESASCDKDCKDEWEEKKGFDKEEEDQKE